MVQKISWQGCALALAVLTGFAGLACNTSPRRLIRLGSLVRNGKPETVSLPAGRAVPAAFYRSEPSLNAARIARLKLQARGSARLATLTWRLAGDHGFPAFRTLSFPVAPDGAEHSYEIDMRREPYWTGRVQELRLAVDQGALDIERLTGESAEKPYRAMPLHGESHPSLPGLERIEMKLPDDLPAGSVLEVEIGLAPEYDRPGSRAVFRAWQQSGKDRDLVLEETIEGTGLGGSGWHLVRQRLSGGGGTLSLEVTASKGGQPLPEGAALWGDPVLITPGHVTGKNLVVILVDTLRADVVGAYGSREGLTPNLDRFAAEGTRFAEMTSPAPWTLPTVSSLMTGLQPQTHGAGMVIDPHFAPTGLPSGVPTLARTLRDAGFYTFGVYHNTFVNPAFGLNKGFEGYVSLEAGADVLVDRALEGMKRYSSDRRVFLYLHLFDVHTPYQPPEEECRTVARRFAPGYHGSLGCVADRNPKSSTAVPPPADRRWYEALYHAEVANVDRQIGRFLAGLHQLGHDDDTVVAVLSDHGEDFWTRLDREKEWGYDTTGDHGHTLYRELLHVPAMVRVPGRAPAVIPEAVQTVDLFPTLLHLVGVTPPPNQGQDLVPHLDGAPLPRRLLLADAMLYGQPRWSVRQGPWKLIVPRQAGPPLELYNLDQDPGETRNLAGSQPAVVASLRTLGERELAQRHKDRARFLSGGDIASAVYLDWLNVDELRSLGYLR